MFEHVTAYPNGDIVYEYKDTIVTERKNALPTITIKLFEKELNGFCTRNVDIYNSSNKFMSN